MSLVSCSDKFSQIHFINYSRIISENLNTCATMQTIQHALKEVHTKYLRVSIFCSGFIFDRKYILKIYSFFQFSKLAQCSMYNGGWGGLDLIRMSGSDSQVTFNLDIAITEINRSAISLIVTGLGPR